MTSPVSVSLLGPIEVQTAEGSVPVAGVKLQALLALLALSAPRPVSADRLIDELWGDDQPAKPANALQAQVSQLRRVLGSDAVVRDGSGYVLSVEPERVDSAQLDRSVRDGREAAHNGEHRAAAARFAEAISLVRGPSLADLLDHGFAREAASRLDQLVITAHEGLIDAELACGHHAQVLPQVTELVGAHPLWERFHAQLMVALFRCGRQSDALRAYQRARELLADEMGLEPGPELRALERAILTHDPSLAAPVPLALTAPPSALPAPATSFVGRADELTALEGALEVARLVTLVGPAGVGKTRLVLEVLRGVAATREVWFVELAPVVPATVAETVASAIGAQDHSSSRGGTAHRPPAQRAIERFGNRDVLMVLDNCEHVLDAAAELVDRLQSACPHLQIVATSREPLGLDGECQLALGPLTDEDGGTLFAIRARAVQPRFRAEQAELADLCRRLDGLPLAIELAAARAKTLPVPEITARLHDRFGLLVTHKRSGPDRLHGLRAAIDWSYDLLFEDEQEAFRRLAVFAGGVTLDAAQLVCGPDALDIVSRLVDKSLVVADTEGRSARFRMLESLRAYALDRLAERGETDDALAAHRQWCIGLAEEAEEGIRTPDQVDWLDRLDAEHDNLRAALDHATTADPISGLRLIGLLILPWWFRSRGREARHWVDAYLELAPDAPPAVRTKALTWSGLLADFGSARDQPGGLEQELDLADRRQREAVALSHASGDALAVGYAQAQHALTLTRRRLAGIRADPAEAEALIVAATHAFAEHGDDFGCGITRTIEAVGWLAAGDVDRCRAVASTARAHAVRCGDLFVQGRVEWINGMLADAGGDPDEAYRHVERGLVLLDRLGMSQEFTTQAALLIALAERRGHHQLAAQWRAFVAGHSGGLARHDVLLIASARNVAGQQARAACDLGRARTLHLEALALYEEAGVNDAIAFTQSCLGFLSSEMEDRAAADIHHTAALSAAASSGDASAIALALEGIASVFPGERAEQAALLLGAAVALRADAGRQTDASHGSDVAAITDRARLCLGSARFEDAYDRGARMSPSEVSAAVGAPWPSTSATPQARPST